MKESSVNVTLGVGEIVKEVKDTKTIEEVDKTSALVVRAIHAALSPLEKWVLQKEYNLSETKKLLEEKLKDIPAENIITPPAYVAVPALQSIAYCMDDIQLRDMERIFDETHNVDVANTLAILEANEHAIYDPPAVFDSNKAEILLSTEERLREIYEAFPNEGKVVLGYSYLVSWNYVTWLDFPRPIDEELISLFKKWIRKFPENKLELMEYYSFILFEKWLYMDSLDNISEANKIYYEIKAIADELSKDYADNQVTQMLSMGIVRKL